MIMKFVPTNLVVFAGLLSAPLASAKEGTPSVTRETSHDPRVNLLRNFFVKYRSPVIKFVDVFLNAADENSLDWRLLPSISIIESGGGKEAFHNNIFGWGTRKMFPSVPHGIWTVAEVLSKSDLYRHRDTDGILRLYNPYPDYGPRVKAVMRSVGPARVPAWAALN